MHHSKWSYYLLSIPTLLWGITNWPSVTMSLLHTSDKRHRIVRLRNGCRFQVRTLMDIWIIKETCLDRQYQRASVEIEDGWNVIDIGAGLGDFAICVARRCPNSTIHGYEPLPESFKLLEANLRLNQIQTVMPYPKAVGSTDEVMELHLISTEAVQQSTAADGSGATQQSILVPGISLDQAVENLGSSKCDYLKMDCEGAEFEILLNASASTLARIARICLEYHDGVTEYTHVDLQNFLSEKGFCVTLTSNPVHANLGILYAQHNAI